MKVKHPLIDPKSTHYQGDKPTIKLIEETLDIFECIGFAKANIIKYSSRMDKKGQAERDGEKIANYEAYLNFLESCKKSIKQTMQNADLVRMKCVDVYDALDIYLDYNI